MARSITNADLIAAIDRWQAEPLVQTLLCRDGCGEKLAAAEVNGAVVLSCPACGRRYPIPEIVRKFEGLSEATRKFLGS